MRRVRALAAAALAAGCGGPPPARITGVFVSGFEGRHDAAWWGRELAAMRARGLDTVIVQHATYGRPGAALYAPNEAGLPAPSGDLIGNLLTAAEGLPGMGVFLGLGYRTDWKFSGVHTAAEYRSLAVFNRAVADDLWRRFGRSPAFAGWYVPQEPDGQRTWLPVSAAPGTPMGRLVRGYYLPLMTRLKELAPGKPIAIAPFFGWNAMSPGEFRRWWRLLLGICPVDVLMLQDGVGVFHGSLGPAVPGGARDGDALAYLAAARDACRGAGASLWLDLEIFRQRAGGGFVPASEDGGWLGRRWYPGWAEQLAREAPLVRARGPRGDKIVCYEWGAFRSTKCQASR